MTIFHVNVKCEDCDWIDWWYESSNNLEDGEDQTTRMLLLHTEYYHSIS